MHAQQRSSKQRCSGWGKGEARPPLLLTPHSRHPMSALLIAWSQHQWPKHMLSPAWTTGPQWLVSSRGQALPPSPLSDCPSVQRLRLQASWSPAHGSLWWYTPGLLPHSSAGRSFWVKDFEKACHPRSFKPFCTHFPSFLFQKHFFSAVAVEHKSKHTYLIFQDIFYT